jgi:ATP-dependent DNA helicase RecG
LRDTPTKGETLTVEFKSDRKPLPDRELVAAIVALANAEGGTLFLGVEDDGTVTGSQYQDFAGLAVLIANKTNPSITNSLAC